MRPWKQAIAAIGGAATIFCAGDAPAADAKYAKLFDGLWTTINENFYDPHFHGVDWRATGDRYRAKLGDVQSDAQFAALATAMLAELKSSHLYVQLPVASKAFTSGIGARFATIDGVLTVVEVSPVSDARRRGVRVGDRLIGPRGALNGPLGSVASVGLESCDGRRKTLKVRREAAFWPPEHPGWRWSVLGNEPGRTIGYLRVDRFDDGAAEIADTAMAELKSTKALIIDVRNNSGGNTSALRLGAYFTDIGEKPVLALFARPYLEALGHPVTKADVLKAPKALRAYTDATVFKAVSDGGGGAVFYNEEIGAARYGKPVIVLTSEDTGSSGDGFARFMHTNTKARLLGRTTAGKILSGEDFPIGEGWSVTLPAQGLWDGDGVDISDRAVSPDITIPLGRAALCSGRDVDIEQALDLLAQH
jgi:carboxyl-terminal processing protease